MERQRKTKINRKRKPLSTYDLPVTIYDLRFTIYYLRFFPVSRSRMGVGCALIAYLINCFHHRGSHFRGQRTPDSKTPEVG